MNHPVKDKLSGVIDFFAARLPRRPAAYLFLFIAWMVTLWFLSEGNPAPEGGPKILHLDKIAHFGYFFGGGGLLAGFLGLRQKREVSGGYLKISFIVIVLVGCIIGRLDEYHQSFTPGRSGNDNGDWLADIIGASVGAWVMLVTVLPRLKKWEKQAHSSQDGEIVANTLD